MTQDAPADRAPKRRRAYVSRNPATVTARVLAAAQAEFMAEGYEAASTNRIAAAFGGSKATLFRHFPTKLALLEAVVADIASRWQGAVAPERIEAAAPAEWLRQFAVMTLRWMLSDELMFLARLGVSELGRFPQLRTIFLAAATTPLERALTAKLREWTEEGTLASGDPEGDTVCFFDLMFNGPSNRALFGVLPLGDAAIAAHIDRAIDVFLRGRAVR